MMKLFSKRFLPITYFAFFLILSLSFLNSIYDTILFGIPWLLFYCCNAYIGMNDFLWHILYLSLTCYYFKLKLSYINQQINSSRTTKDAFRLSKLLNSLHNEIHTYNRQFWMTHIADSICQFMLMIN